MKNLILDVKIISISSPSIDGSAAAVNGGAETYQDAQRRPLLNGLQSSPMAPAASGGSPSDNGSATRGQPRTSGGSKVERQLEQMNEFLR